MHHVVVWLLSKIKENDVIAIASAVGDLPSSAQFFFTSLSSLSATGIEVVNIEGERGELEMDGDSDGDVGRVGS